jgi:transcriptional regulator with PAS, ATPase and Fis domain
VRCEEFGFENLRKALNHMKGTLLICDRDRNVVYYNDVVCSALNIPAERLDGANLMDLAEEGYILNSASIQAFETKQLSIKYVQGKMKVPILTVSNPVLDEDGEVALVVAISFNEQITELVTREMMESRIKSTQLLDLLSAQVSANTVVIAESAAMKSILTFLSRIAAMDSTVLLTGETGTGKEVLAKYIHNQSARSGGVFVPVNCAAIPESLMESEFFGYAKGAFTGANRDGKAGVFELADGGTIFLDEIGEMPILIQAKFLRVIETGEVTRLGSESSKKVNFRLVAATNRNLEEMCAQGLFRSDLYYRLNILSVEIPPLRERRDDIVPLARFFLNLFNKKYNKTKILSYSAIKWLEHYRWPGNVRELRNVIERLFITSSTDILDFESGYNVLPSAGSEPLAEPAAPGRTGPEPAQEGSSLHDAVEAYEKQLILETLDACGGSVSKAAGKLRLHKSVLYRKLEKYRSQAAITLPVR